MSRTVFIYFRDPQRHVLQYTDVYTVCEEEKFLDVHRKRGTARVDISEILYYDDIRENEKGEVNE